MDSGRLDTVRTAATHNVAGDQGDGHQEIPRPADIDVGPPPPWAGRPPALVSVADVRAALASGSSESNDPRYSPPVENDGNAVFRPAAVLCAVYGDSEGQACVVLTRRSRELRSHTGEVSFPGGRMDEGESPTQTALREAHEEVGIDPACVEVIGGLAPLSTWANPSRIVPVVGILPGVPRLTPNPTEVDRAFAVRLSELYGDGVGHEERWSLGERTDRPMYFFALAGDTVWGATARMLQDLLERVWDAALCGR